MKYPIQWHKECLRNMTASAQKKREEANRVREDADRIDRDVAFLARQIEAAEKAGKDGFDGERFMAKSSNDRTERRGTATLENQKPL
jgi:hypothetical protein